MQNKLNGCISLRLKVGETSIENMALNNLKLFKLFTKSITPTCFAEAALEELDSLYGNIERSKSIRNKLCKN